MAPSVVKVFFNLLFELWIQVLFLVKVPDQSEESRETSLISVPWWHQHALDDIDEATEKVWKDGDSDEHLESDEHSLGVASGVEVPETNCGKGREGEVDHGDQPIRVRDQVVDTIVFIVIERTVHSFGDTHVEFKVLDKVAVFLDVFKACEHGFPTAVYRAIIFFLIGGPKVVPIVDFGLKV